MEPKAFSEHLRKIHKTRLELCRQVEIYVAGFPHQYTYRTILLPPDGSTPQPLLPVLEGLYCKHCTDRSRSRKLLREHCNKAHQLSGRRTKNSRSSSPPIKTEEHTPASFLQAHGETSDQSRRDLVLLQVLLRMVGELPSLGEVMQMCVVI